MSGSRRTYRTLPLDVPHSPAERIALSWRTSRTLPREVPHSVLHSPAERPSKIDAYFVACAVPKSVDQRQRKLPQEFELRGAKCNTKPPPLSHLRGAHPTNPSAFVHQTCRGVEESIEGLSSSFYEPFSVQIVGISSYIQLRCKTE
ncbi:hypothetical protein Bbelb_309550 [Branchiostoma belcheri]|nr:hypothetical protein Bbelb_309550 [Branchiostoma belcheri]